MIDRPLLISDFDGVIIDGVQEYWESSRGAFFSLIEEDYDSDLLPIKIPPAFRSIRPWVNQGWEMVVLTADLSQRDPTDHGKYIYEFSNHYKNKLQEVIEIWGWHPLQIQNALDDFRRDSIGKDLSHWLANHQTFPGVIERLKRLSSEGFDFGILTTKSEQFVSQILNRYELKPQAVYGYEAGNKTDVLKKLSQNRAIVGFIEDRRATLETILQAKKLQSIPCFLASWGYLKPMDKSNLPSNIILLEPETFASPLADWH